MVSCFCFSLWVVGFKVIFGFFLFGIRIILGFFDFIVVRILWADWVQNIIFDSGFSFLLVFWI